MPGEWDNEIQPSQEITAEVDDETHPPTETCDEVSSDEDGKDYAIEFIVDVRFDHHVSIATYEDKLL